MTIIDNMTEEMIGKAELNKPPFTCIKSEKRVPIEKDKADSFHKVVMLLQSFSQRERPYVRTTESFLCKRVGSQDDDEYKS